MKFNFKKISAIATSVLMTGLTVGSAAAASFTDTFVSNGQADVAVIYGASADMTDHTGANNIYNELSSLVTGTTSVSEGSSLSLKSGSDLLYLNDDLSENIQTITKNDLSNTLADGTFTDDDGTDYDYEQTITIGTSTSNNVAFSDSDNDFDDPEIMMDLSTSTSTPIYTWSVTFDNAVAFNATDSEGEELTLFGKTYTVGTATDADTLVLLGGSDSTRIDVGETETMMVNDKSYVVSLDGISSATTAQAGITINGETKTFTEGQTKTVAGIDVYVKTVFRTGDDMGYVEVQLGADKLTFESGNAVQYGSDNDDIDGTLVTITGGVNAMTAMTIKVAAEDNDVNNILLGDSFVDPVFGTLSLVLSEMENAPTIVDHEDTSVDRNLLEITKGGDRELQLTFTDAAGNTETVPFTYQGSLADDNSNAIEIVEGATLADDEYFILNSGNYQHLMQMTKVDADSSGQVTFKDVMTGTSYGTESGTNHTAAQTEYISNQAYTITRVDNTHVTITSSDYSLTSGSGTVSVYPYLELVNGEDHRFAFTDNVSINNVKQGTTIALPTGSITLSTNTTVSDETAGSVEYVIGVTAHDATSANLTIAVATDMSGDTAETDPAILFVEDEDKSETTTTTKNAVLLPTVDSTYSQCSNPVFTGTSDSSTFDDSDYTGYLTNFGTYVLKDGSDTNQAFTSLTYPDNMMSFEVYFAEADAVTTTTDFEIGEVVVTDAEYANVKTKDLIVIGGSCINAVAAELLGVAANTCGMAFSDATNVDAGEFLIKEMTNPNNEDKVALVVAGYEAADTTAGVTYLTHKDYDTGVFTSSTNVDLIEKK